jgi:hypothetical protein
MKIAQLGHSLYSSTGLLSQIAHLNPSPASFTEELEVTKVC